MTLASPFMSVLLLRGIAGTVARRVEA